MVEFAGNFRGEMVFPIAGGAGAAVGGRIDLAELAFVLGLEAVGDDCFVEAACGDGELKVLEEDFVEARDVIEDEVFVFIDGFASAPPGALNTRGDLEAVVHLMDEAFGERNGAKDFAGFVDLPGGIAAVGVAHGEIPGDEGVAEIADDDESPDTLDFGDAEELVAGDETSGVNAAGLPLELLPIAAKAGRDLIAGEGPDNAVDPSGAALCMADEEETRERLGPGPRETEWHKRTESSKRDGARKRGIWVFGQAPESPIPPCVSGR